MRAPLSWLRDYAPFDQPAEELAAALSSLGLVVESVTPVGGNLDGVVVAHILDIRPHPKADRIRLVDVDWGGPDGEPLQIACGAWNMHPGDLVPLATIGAVLPNGMEIARRKMRGEWSNGMLCSPTEVGLPETPGVDGLLILPPGLAAPGTPLADALDLRPDVVFDLDITPNRPDALCMAGVARDLAAVLQLPWSWPTGTGGRADRGAGPAAAEGGVRSGDTVDPGVGSATVVVDSPDLCPRFTATVIEGVPTGPSPAWLARRLTLAGMRPISYVVDVSNYVMLDVGQPNHAYDLDRLGGHGIRVRRAIDGEQIVTLDGTTRTLTGDDCLICDANSVPVGIGGIMGGADSEIAEGTTTVLLEAAYFTPMSIARTGKRLGLTSEARTRFERGIDPEVAPVAIRRFVELLADGGPATSAVRRGPTVDVAGPGAHPHLDVPVRTTRVNAILGTHLTSQEIAGLLRPIGFVARPTAEGVQSVTIPTWRPDSEREIDVIEEVGRLYGYRRIERVVPPGSRRGGGLTAIQKSRRQLRDIFVGAGLTEAWTTTFLAPGDLERAGLPALAVEVENPLDQAESILRTSLLPGLLKAVRFNTDRQASEVRLFEVGRVFEVPSGDADSPVPVEREEVAAVLAGPSADGRLAAQLWAVLASALRLNGIDPKSPGVRLEAATIPGLHPSRAARLVGASGGPLGVVGEVDPDVASSYGLPGRAGYLSFDLPRLLAEPRPPRVARAVSRYPASDVDLAFLVSDAVPAAAVEATLVGSGGPELESVRLFDVYRGGSVGKGRRSLAFRLRFRAGDRTLSDAELAEARTRAVDAVLAAHGGELRG